MQTALSIEDPPPWSWDFLFIKGKGNDSICEYREFLFKNIYIYWWWLGSGRAAFMRMSPQAVHCYGRLKMPTLYTLAGPSSRKKRTATYRAT